MANSNYELYGTLKSIEHKLTGVEGRLAALDDKFESLEKKIIDVILRCLGGQPTPFYWGETTNLMHSVEKVPVQHDTNFEENVNFLNDGTGDSELNFDKISDSKNSGISSDNFKTIESSDNDDTKSDQTKSYGSIKKEAFDFLSVLHEKPKCGCTNGFSTSIITAKSANGNSSDISDFSRSSSTTSETGKKPKKPLYASQVLEFIGNFIQVTDRQEYIQHYNAVIKFFIAELKTDDTFKHIFKGVVMAGSYRDGLKISKPNEFDTIMRLNFGDKKHLIVERIPGQPAHCTIKLIDYDAKVKPYLKQFLDPEGYLLQDTIIIWLQNLFRRIIKPYDDNNKIIKIGEYSYQYSHSINGPAFTFKLWVINTDIKFDMDLVPAIPFDFTHWVATRDYSKDSNQINWIAVPKPPKGGVQRKNRSFICSYTEMEKHILLDSNQAKNLIRIFKKLRDKQELKYLKSYFIKTIFLWQFDNTTIEERKIFWLRSLEIIFLDMFKIILNRIQNRELPFYWEPGYNMFSAIGETKLKSWEDKLRGIFSRLDAIIADNPKGLIDIILTPEEKKLLECRHEAKLCPDQTILQSSL